jgi:ATP/maltotriose-dependent transcriptional regulator MalT
MVPVFPMALGHQYLENDGEVIIKTDTSDYISTRVPSSHEIQGVLNAGAYVLKKHTLMYWNYDIYYYALMTVINELEQCILQGKGVAYDHQLLTNHRNLDNLKTTSH